MIVAGSVKLVLELSVEKNVCVSGEIQLQKIPGA